MLASDPLINDSIICGFMTDTDGNVLRPMLISEKPFSFGTRRHDPWGQLEVI